MEIFLSNVNYKVGSMTDISAIRQLEADPASLKYLKNLGIVRFSKESEPARECLKKVAQDFLAGSRLDAGDIDGIIYFSTMFDVYREFDDLPQVCHELGFRNAIPFGMFLNQCTNYSQALVLAKHLVGNDGLRNVLLLGSDRSDDARDYRVMPNNTSVYSDITVAALVSSSVRKGYAIREISHRYLPELAGISAAGNIIDFIEKYSLGFSSVCKSLYAKSGLSPADFKYLVTANYNHSVVKNLVSLAGMPPGTAYTENIGKLAHCFAADQLISAEELQDAVPSGARLNLVAVGGFWLFSAVCLERV
jgi:3-oxoacyl-[acyl-carrier-protein] synthase-3